MKIGLIAFSTDTGLGYQSLEFAKHIKCEKILLIDLGIFNNLPTHNERFEGLGEIRNVNGMPMDSDLEWITDGVDLIFHIENPLNYRLYETAKAKGVKTVLQYNYEFLEYFRSPDLFKPDFLASPAPWNLEKVATLGIPIVGLPVPYIDRKVLKSVSGSAKRFVHIIGRPAQDDRNGTMQFLQAIETYEGDDDVEFAVYYQQPQERVRIENFKPIEIELARLEAKLFPRLKIYIDTEDNLDMYRPGDILVMPRKYGGLCLPMQEALSSRNPVIMTDIKPNNLQLPSLWLCRAIPDGEIKTSSIIPMFKADVQDLQRIMKEVAENYATASDWSFELTRSRNWYTMRPIYLKFFREICKKK